MKLRKTLCFILAALYGAGICVASDGDSKSIIKQLKSTGMRSAYERETNFNAALNLIFDSVYFCLKRRNVEILAYDKADLLVAWCDTVGSFASLPTDESFDTLEQVSSITSTFGGGYTYGSSLITKLDDNNSQLSIFTMGRNADVSEETYSDGTYERELINEVSRHIYKVTIGQASGVAANPTSKPKVTTPATNYASAFRGRFRGLLDCSTSLISTNIQGIPYSVPVDRLWTSLLRVVVQYDAVIDIKAAEHKVVFARSLSVPDPGDTNSTKRVESLMVAYLEPVSTNSCLYRLGVLDQLTLAPKPVVGRSVGGNDIKIPVLKEVPNFMKAACIVASQLDRQLDCQMFYSERWGDKFLRRNNELAPPHP